MRLTINDSSITDILSRTISELSQLIVHISDTCVFEPPFGRLRDNGGVYIGLIGNRVVDFILVLTDFFAKCYG